MRLDLRRVRPTLHSTLPKRGRCTGVRKSLNNTMKAMPAGEGFDSQGCHERADVAERLLGRGHFTSSCERESRRRQNLAMGIFK